ncbi:MAG: Phage tail collar domain protein [Sphingomonas bacterium]|uniref:phage tail protein n=1 Tax=Sphingomonas bacterium TaxID=1895847 RepID=UPI0026200000|nr:tail fiber protein [Sphingomonas bacterium]MDB5696106.1 Phage tail collar domain protein [Sphingomonas bacterium]
MADPFLGEIMMFGGNFAPRGWALCNGQLLTIVNNEALFSLVGTTYGGNGQTNFALPDLQGRLPMHRGTLNGTTHFLGEKAGAESVTLTVQQMGAHTHPMFAATSATTKSPAGAVLGPPSSTQAGLRTYNNTAAPALVPLNPQSVTSAGGSQPHSNMQPCLCVNFIIAVEGIFPSRN